MILLISTCSKKLSEEEFVKPIAKIIKKGYEIKHYTEKIDFRRYEKIIICGTALRDNEYLDKLTLFNWVNELKIPILGICSGMQVIALRFGAKLIMKKEIGMAKIKTLKSNILFEGEFEAYALHGNSLSNLANFEIFAKSEKSVQAIKHKTKSMFGIMFHPEVRNGEIVERFLLF